MKKKLMIVLIIVIVIAGAIFAWRIAYSLQKNTDNNHGAAEEGGVNVPLIDMITARNAVSSFVLFARLGICGKVTRALLVHKNDSFHSEFQKCV